MFCEDYRFKNTGDAANAIAKIAGRAASFMFDPDTKLLSVRAEPKEKNDISRIVFSCNGEISRRINSSFPAYH